MNEEPFGPVAVTRPFDTFDEVIEQANRLPFGLAAFAFTENGRRANLIGDAGRKRDGRHQHLRHLGRRRAVRRGQGFGLRQRRRQRRPGELSGGQGDPPGVSAAGMTPLLAQRLIAVPFLVLGAWCLFFPQWSSGSASAGILSRHGDHRADDGLLRRAGDPRRPVRFVQPVHAHHFLAYGIALLPFFRFNYWFVFVVPMFNQWMLLDFGANVAMLALCVIGYRASRSERAAERAATAGTRAIAAGHDQTHRRPHPCRPAQDPGLRPHFHRAGRKLPRRARRASRQAEIDVVVCRQEGGVAYMADADGKMTGRPGVAFVTRGPGATNASGGVHVAFQDSTPMILFIGDVARGDRDREGFQEIDFPAFFGPIAKWAARIEDARRIPEYVARAYRVATAGRPGPGGAGAARGHAARRGRGARPPARCRRSPKRPIPARSRLCSNC